MWSRKREKKIHDRGTTGEKRRGDETLPDFENYETEELERLQMFSVERDITLLASPERIELDGGGTNHDK